MVLPLALGQLARFTPLRKLHERKPKAISRLSECILLSIIYTTFCDTFANNAGEANYVSKFLSSRDQPRVNRGPDPCTGIYSPTTLDDPTRL